jgi:hypothetical protein
MKVLSRIIFTTFCCCIVYGDSHVYTAKFSTISNSSRVKRGLFDKLGQIGKDWILNQVLCKNTLLSSISKNTTNNNAIKNPVWTMGKPRF